MENLGIIFCEFVRFSGFPGRILELCFVILRDFRAFLGEYGYYFLRFCGSFGISWENIDMIVFFLRDFRAFLVESGWK